MKSLGRALTACSALSLGPHMLDMAHPHRSPSFPAISLCQIPDRGLLWPLLWICRCCPCALEVCSCALLKLAVLSRHLFTCLGPMALVASSAPIILSRRCCFYPDLGPSQMLVWRGSSWVYAQQAPIVQAAVSASGQLSAVDTFAEVCPARSSTPLPLSGPHQAHFLPRLGVSSSAVNRNIL